jgi:hypothetical protein
MRFTFRQWRENLTAIREQLACRMDRRMAA